MKTSVVFVAFYAIVCNVTSERITTTDYSFLATIKYDFKVDTLPHLLGKLLSENVPTVEESITFGDFVNLLNCTNATLAQATHLATKLHLWPHVTLENFENLLLNHGISAITLYTNFVKFLKEPRTAIPHILNTFSINPTVFLDHISFGGDDPKLFEIIEQGNFTRHNIKVALQIANKTVEDIYVFLRPHLLEGLASDSMVTVLETLEAMDSLEYFESVFDVFPVDHKEILKNKALNDYLQTFKQTLSDQVIVASFVSRSNLATHINAFLTWEEYGKYLVFLAETSAGNFTVNRCTRNAEDMALMTTETWTKTFIQITENYSGNSASTCRYLWKNGSEIADVLAPAKVTNVGLSWTKAPPEFFQLGAPLVCGIHLYGLAFSQTGGGIEFSRFELSESTVWTSNVTSDSLDTLMSFSYRISLSPAILLGMTIILSVF